MADTSFTSGAKRRTRKVPFTVAIAGASGTGKSALVDALAGRRLVRDDTALVNTPETGLRITQHALEEDAEFMPIVLDVHNSGALDAEGDIDELTRYLEGRFDEMVSEQSRIRRNPRFQDRRVHACIYLLHAPHGLVELDVVSMTRLSTLTTVIPVIAGAEALTPEELREMKIKVREDCTHYKIPVFEFDEMEWPLHITRTNEYDKDGAALLSLRLAYGRVDATDPAVSDFNALRVAVFRTFTFDIIDHTVDILYEQYRTIRLSDPTARYSVLEPEALAAHATRLKQEMLERESRELKDQEDRINRELEKRRQEILERENELRRIEKQLEEERQARQSALETHKLAQRNALLEAERNISTTLHDTDPLDEADEADEEGTLFSPQKPNDPPMSRSSSLSVKSAKSALIASEPPMPTQTSQGTHGTQENPHIPAKAVPQAPIAPQTQPPQVPNVKAGVQIPPIPNSRPPIPNTTKQAQGSAKTGPVLSGTAKTGPILGTAKTGPILGTAKTGPILTPKPAPINKGAVSPSSPHQGSNFETGSPETSLLPPKLPNSGSSPGSPKLGRKISLSSLGAAASAAASSVTARLKPKPTSGSPYAAQHEFDPPSPRFGSAAGLATGSGVGSAAGSGNGSRTSLGGFDQDHPTRSFVSLQVARSSSGNNSPQVEPARTPPVRPSMSDKRPPSFIAADTNVDGIIPRNSFNRKPSNARDSPSLSAVGTSNYDTKFSHSGTSLGSESARASPSLPPRSPNRPSSFVSLDGTLSRTRSIPDKMGAAPTTPKQPYSPVMPSPRQMQS